MHFCLRHPLTEDLGAWHCQGELERIQDMAQLQAAHSNKCTVGSIICDGLSTVLAASPAEYVVVAKDMHNSLSQLLLLYVE